MNTSTPKVSVIVCTYNQESTIARALDSILMQEVDFNYEIILADDCSKDRTPDICRTYASRYPDKICLYLNSANKGMVDNYFDCVECCRGEYIADLAGDDVWVDKNKLAKQAVILDGDNEIALCHAGWRPVLTDGSFADTSQWQMATEPYVTNRGEITLHLLRHEKCKYFIHLCSAMYRRDTLKFFMDKYPTLFRSKELVCEDLQINVLLSSIGKIAYIPDIVMHYTVGAPSISSTENPIKVIRFHIGVIALTLRLAETLGYDKSELKSYLHDSMQYIIMQYFVDLNFEGRNLVNDFIRNKQIPLSLKNRITLLLSHNRHIWEAVRYIRKLCR